MSRAVVLTGTAATAASLAVAPPPSLGPYVPLLVPWVDRWLLQGYAKELKAALFGSSPQGGEGHGREGGLLRRGVPYLAVSQNDQGLHGLFDAAEWPNILVLSAGGYGHAAIPLLKQEEPLLETKTLTPVAQRPTLAAFEGTLGHGPGNVRGRMAAAMRAFEKHMAGVAVGADKNQTVARCEVYSGGDWKAVMARSRLQLNPRGFGRTSYHVSETVQMVTLLPELCRCECSSRCLVAAASHAPPPTRRLWTPPIGPARPAGL
jgi:hypothetical protein